MPIIDRNSPIPAYYQVETDLKNRIAHREWKANEQIPSEIDLAAQYSVSRITLRQALAELEKDGFIVKYRGKGAFVCENPSQFVHDLKYSLVSGGRIEGSETILTANMISIQLIETPYPDVNTALEISTSAPCVYFKRVFILDGKPIAIGKSWIPADLVPNLEKEGLIANSLSRTMKERYNLNVVKVDDVLETVRPTAQEKELLEASYDTPLILIKGISYLDSGRPLEYSNTLWLGDRVRFHLSLEKEQNGFVIKS